MFAWRIREQKKDELELKKAQIIHKIREDKSISALKEAGSSMKLYYAGRISVLEENLRDIEELLEDYSDLNEEADDDE